MFPRNFVENLKGMFGREIRRDGNELSEVQLEVIKDVRGATGGDVLWYVENRNPSRWEWNFERVFQGAMGIGVVGQVPQLVRVEQLRGVAEQPPGAVAKFLDNDSTLYLRQEDVNIGGFVVKDRAEAILADRAFGGTNGEVSARKKVSNLDRIGFTPNRSEFKELLGSSGCVEELDS